MKYFKKLVGDTIYLSPRNIEDAEKLTEWMNDFQVTDYTGRSHQTVTLQDEIEYFQNKDNNDAKFFIVTLAENKLIGTLGLHSIDYINRTATLGIFIGDKDYRDRGIGTESIRLLLEFGFRYLNLHTVSLSVIKNVDLKSAVEKENLNL